MIILFALWATLFTVFVASLGFTYAYLRRQSSRPWSLKLDESFRPTLSVLVPVHNEEANVTAKLENLRKASYPADKMEILIVDDASTDSTVTKVSRFIAENPDMNVRIFTVGPRSGKARALNRALSETSGSIVVISDADCLWSDGLLEKTLPYMADPSVGAVSGMQQVANSPESWSTRAEEDYLRLSSLLRVGESKIYSTIRFEGGVSLYKRSAFESFDDRTGADDSGTALRIVQNRMRAIVVPEAIFYSSSPSKLSDRLHIKARRANHLISLWTKCLKLSAAKKLALPKKIAIPNFMLFLFNPLILILLGATTIALVALYPLSIFSLFVLAIVAAAAVLARRTFVEIIVDNLVLFYALVGFASGRRYLSWE